MLSASAANKRRAVVSKSKPVLDGVTSDTDEDEVVPKKKANRKAHVSDSDYSD